MASDTVTKLQEISQQPFTDEKERKELYDAAIKLAYSVESPQDTAQRLYHGVCARYPDPMKVGMRINLWE